MKNIIFVSALTFVANAYADIASTTYVDSIANAKQEALTAGPNITINGNTISATDTKYNTSTASTAGIMKLYAGTGSATDGTITQNAITAALSNKQDILPMAARPTSGKYNLIWNGDMGKFIFEKVRLQCDAGTYDLGFDQCIDANASTLGSSGYWGVAPNPYADDYGLTGWGQWGVTLYTGDKIKGIVSCNSTPGTTMGETTDQEFSNTATGRYLWIKMTEPAVSSWIYMEDYVVSFGCKEDGPSGAVSTVHNVFGMLFSTIVQ